MKGQYYRIDWDTCDRLHLYGREAMVYCALIYLCKKAPYTGSATELADFSHCGTKRTTLRMLSSLIGKGLILKSADGIVLGQNVSDSGQNVTPSGQNVPISKEKRTKKENIIKENKESESFNTSPAPAKMFKKDDFIPPTWNEWWAFAKEKQMGQFEAQKSFSYYEMRGWRDVFNWKAALVYWDLKNKT